MLFNPLAFAQDTIACGIDARPRAVLCADIMRERGNRYHAQLAGTVANAPDFPAEPVMCGDTLPWPPSHGLARILLPADVPTDARRRPFIAVDARAGQGPDVGGCKTESKVAQLHPQAQGKPRQGEEKKRWLPKKTFEQAAEASSRATPGVPLKTESGAGTWAPKTQARQAT